MSDNLADFLNDNAGVVTGAAGLAVHRNITATNRNLTALRGELGKLQDRFAREQKKEARESLNREMLFQISQQVETISSANPSPDQYFELLRVSEDFKKLGFTSATFNSLQDKSYWAAVLSSLDQSLKKCLESLPEETRSLVTAAVAWNSLLSLSSSIAQVDEYIAGRQAEVLEARRWLTVLENTVIGGSAVMAWITGGAGRHSEKNQLSKDKKEANRRVLHAEDQIKRYRTKRSALVQQLSDLKEIPSETLHYYGSEAADYSERLNQLKDVSEYLNQVGAALNIDTGKLDTGDVPDIAVDHQFGYDGTCRRCGCTKQAVNRFGFACNL